MRLAISLAVFAACMVLVMLTGAKTAHSTELAAAAIGGAEAGLSGLDDDNGSPIEGRRIYMRENCYICHGGFVGGGMCPSLRDRRPDYHKGRKEVRRRTPSGMPPFPELTVVDIRNIPTYSKTLRTRAEPTFTHWWDPVQTQ